MTADDYPVLIAALVAVVSTAFLIRQRRRAKRREADRLDKLRTIGRPHSLEEWRIAARVSQERSDARRGRG